MTFSPWTRRQTLSSLLRHPHDNGKTEKRYRIPPSCDKFIFHFVTWNSSALVQFRDLSFPNCLSSLQIEWCWALMLICAFSRKKSFNYCMSCCPASGVHVLFCKRCADEGTVQAPLLSEGKFTSNRSDTQRIKFYFELTVWLRPWLSIKSIRNLKSHSTVAFY